MLVALTSMDVDVFADNAGGTIVVACTSDARGTMAVSYANDASSTVAAAFTDNA